MKIDDEPPKKSELITDHILEKVTKIKAKTWNRIRYTRDICKHAKEECLNEKCLEIERMCVTDKADMYKKNTRELREQKICTSAGCIKSKDKTVILKELKIL